jgi:hypothetical protein
MPCSICKKSGHNMRTCPSKNSIPLKSKAVGSTVSQVEPITLTTDNILSSNHWKNTQAITSIVKKETTPKYYKLKNVSNEVFQMVELNNKQFGPELDITSSVYQTKEWRKSRTWYKNGKSNECEKYQINLIESIIKLKLMKTHDRINMETNEIISKMYPMIHNDGYEWSENFDGLIMNNNNKYYFNLKFVCGSGGSQTRTLREVYNFIKCQMEYLIKYNMDNIYFINILDGDENNNNNEKFKYLINKEKYKQIIKYLFIGSLYDFQKKKIKII